LMCLKYGVNTLITNYPDRIKKVIEQYETGI
jgi:hypothetical protein